MCRALPDMFARSLHMQNSYGSDGGAETMPARFFYAGFSDRVCFGDLASPSLVVGEPSTKAVVSGDAGKVTTSCVETSSPPFPKHVSNTCPSKDRDSHYGRLFTAEGQHQPLAVGKESETLG